MKYKGSVYMQVYGEDGIDYYINIYLPGEFNSIEEVRDFKFGAKFIKDKNDEIVLIITDGFTQGVNRHLKCESNPKGWYEIVHGEIIETIHESDKDKYQLYIYSEEKGEDIPVNTSWDIIFDKKSLPEKWEGSQCGSLAYGGIEITE